MKYPPLEMPSYINKDMFTLLRELRRGEFIIVFIDTAGEGSDFNAGQFLSKTYVDAPLVMHYEGSIVDVTPQLLPVLKWIHEVTGVKPVIAYETNNGGGYELERLNRLNKDNHFTIYYQYKLDSEGRLERTTKMGWNTNSATRPVMISGIEDLVNNGLVTLYHIPTINEMFSFVKKLKPGGWKAEAEDGAHDDLIMALAGAWQLYQTEEPTEIDDDEEHASSGNITSLWA
jgi:hypothetical protein